MKAWEREYQWISNAKPPQDTKKREENWMSYIENGMASDQKLFKDWENVVPGSLAPCHLSVAAVQAMGNRGYDVSKAESLIEQGLKAAKERDGGTLQKITAEIYYQLNIAKKDKLSDYWNYKQYTSWEEIEQQVTFPKAVPVDVAADEFVEQIRAGWMAQLIGGGLGTQIEGYTTKNIKETFGEIRTYIRQPETYNDDITYELAFLAAFSKKGYELTSKELALAWLELLPDGYSAEEMAIRNLRRGIMPPESGTVNNYFSDWIGVQMRTSIHGMVAPGNPKLAAELAVRDGIISHSNSGILGGIFNAVLTSLAFTETDIKVIIEKTISCIPADSEYYKICTRAWQLCQEKDTWEDAWDIVQEELKEYHWIHAYPNVAAEIIALYYGEHDFNKTAFIIAMEGLDVDCTAAPVLNALGIMIGDDKIDKEWKEPIGNEILTYMRKYNKFTFDELCDKTILSVRNAQEGRSC